MAAITIQPVIRLMQISQLRQKYQALGAKPCHEQRFFQAWLQGRSLDNRYSKAENFLPLAMRQVLPELQAELAQLAHVRSTHPGNDGSARLLVAMADGQTVESVLLPRDGVCVSTQLGCAVGCVFCMTGTEGLIRQLGSAEIVAQVVLARQIRPVRRVVFMGMGEPSHNLDNVLEAITLLGQDGAIGHKNLVFSTVGDQRIFSRLPENPVKPALALSLHSTNAETRAKLLPKAPRFDPEELVNLGEEYARRTAYPIQYQWTLLEGINDSEEELHNIIRLLKGKYAMMNFIPFNAVEGLPYQRPDWERAVEMVKFLNHHGVLCRLRNSAGQEVDGGCGQLRARVINTENLERRRAKAKITASNTLYPQSIQDQNANLAL